MIYPKNFEEKIGFDEIKKLIKGRCLSVLGGEEVNRICFHSKKDEICLLLEEVREMRGIMEGLEDFPSDNYADMRSVLVRIHAAGSYMKESELYDLRNSLSVIASILAFIFRNDETKEEDSPMYPALKEEGMGIMCFPDIITEIDRVINKFGHIKDNASEELKRVRTSLTEMRRSVSIALHGILNMAKQEGYVEKDVTPTMRDGRLVVPVSPAMKRMVKGIVHDESASGKTIYIEPQQVVEGNNQIRQLELEEKRAIIKVLIQVSEMIRPHIDEMLDSYRFMGKIDCIKAKAIFANTIGAGNPVVEDGALAEWYEARHPLLEISLRKFGRQVCPLDIKITENERLVLISGPNAGGKSVCLKTVGLLQYMLQCGIPIPIAEGSRCGIFNNLYIDIGDEQSIENELSTYSSHLLNMKFMLKNADGKSLILIDEFGSGTEPQIGAAIAEVMLERFLKTKTMGVITTHYQNLKYFAENNAGIVNAAMLYDRQEMKPLFQLQIGHAGSSFAIEIARKTGISEDIIKEVSMKVGSDYIQSDKYVQDIVRDKRYWENKREKVHQQEKHLDELIERYESNLKEMEQARKDVIGKAQEKAENLIRESNAKIENTIRSIREIQAEKEQTKQLRKSLMEFKEEALTDSGEDDLIERKMQQLKRRQERQLERHSKKKKQEESHPTLSNEKESDGNTEMAKKWKIGMYCRIKGQETSGKITRIQGKSATLLSGVMQVNVPIDRLVMAKAPEQAEDIQTSYSFLGKATREDIYQKKLKFRPEIDVRGMNGEEALTAVTYFMDDVLLLGVSRVRILHGTGTGYLRMIIRQYLRSLPNIASARDEHVQFGGAGITVVEMK